MRSRLRYQPRSTRRGGRIVSSRTTSTPAAQGGGISTPDPDFNNPRLCPPHGDVSRADDLCGLGTLGFHACVVKITEADPMVFDHNSVSLSAMLVGYFSAHSYSLDPLPLSLL